MPIYYISDTISITITQDSEFSLDLQASDITSTNGVFMITSSRLFEIDKFTETKFNLYATNYILSTDMTSTTSVPVATTNCGSFLTSNIAGSELSNGKIGFVVDTSSLQSPCQVRVYSEVQDFPEIFTFSSLTYISVVCGLESISLNPSISQPVFLTYSKGESPT